MSIFAAARDWLRPAINIETTIIPDNAFAVLHVDRHLSDTERRQVRLAIDEATVSRGIKTVIMEPGMSMDDVTAKQAQSG